MSSPANEPGIPRDGTRICGIRIRPLCKRQRDCGAVRGSQGHRIVHDLVVPAIGRLVGCHRHRGTLVARDKGHAVDGVRADFRHPLQGIHALARYGGDPLSRHIREIVKDARTRRDEDKHSRECRRTYRDPSGKPCRSSVPLRLLPHFRDRIRLEGFRCVYFTKIQFHGSIPPYQFHGSIPP